MGIIRKINAKLKKIKFYGNKHYCPVCKTSLRTFLPMDKSILIDLKKVGYKYAGLNEHLNPEKYNCPICNTTDRDRLYAYYINNCYAKTNEDNQVLDIAPTRLNYLLRNKANFEVITVDLEKEGVDYNINIEEMDCFENQKFDFIVCSHILEHVNYPDKALKEMYRVLKDGGEAILMVPINNVLEETLEDPSHKSPEERLKNYGQEDHVRLFAKKDFFNRIEQAGFKLKKFDIDFFGKDVFDKLGLKDTSVLYVGVK